MICLLIGVGLVGRLGTPDIVADRAADEISAQNHIDLACSITMSVSISPLRSHFFLQYATQFAGC